MKRVSWRVIYFICFLLMVSIWTICTPFMVIGGAAIWAFRGMKIMGYSSRRGYAQIVSAFRNQWRDLDGD